tara:strand:+ start:1579 stop:3282 length:1704 start_codon:yes stop_codon:yes gene_type:complete
MVRSSKISAQLCIDALSSYNINDVVISPGSRCAPLVIELTKNTDFNLYSIIDERSAGFVALGIAQSKNEPVALVCTSGSALLNYAPALAEAFYSKVPLIVISADRPEYLITQGDGQTIKQPGSLNSIVKHFINIPDIFDANSPLLNHANRILNESLSCSLENPRQPVHINMSFDEPLYDTISESLSNFRKIDINIPNQTILNQEKLIEFQNIVKGSKKTLIIVGALPINKSLNIFLEKLNQLNQVYTIIETTSNLTCDIGYCGIDKFMTSVEGHNSNRFNPDVVLTFGNNIISKKIKTWLRLNQQLIHVHFGIENNVLDSFFSISKQFETNDFQQFLELNYNDNSDSTFKLDSDELVREIKFRQFEFEKNIEFSDFLVYKLLSEYIPKKSIVHFGNSSAIRYSQLFEKFGQMKISSNRGTSGIEGSLSTSVGIAYSNPSVSVWCILGDLSFFYDSNAFLNSKLPANLKVVVVNNNGGGIFRIIDGPKTVNKFEEFIETEHYFTSKHICKTFNVHYTSVVDVAKLKVALNNTINSPKINLLEIFTPKQLNDKVLKSFFNSLKTNHEQT